MKATELRRISTSELESLLRKKREDLRQFRFDLAAGKVKNIKDIRETKKDIARILTILRERKSQIDN